MCLFKKLIRNRKYTKTAKNGGVIPPMPDKRVALVPVGCGNCMECRNQKAREWKVRLMEDIKRRKNAKFVTLTFSDESYTELDREIHGDIKGYERDNAIAKLAVRRFCERWRRKYKRSVRHWLVTELGQNGTENIHIHGLLWTDEELKCVAERWQYGHIWPKENWNGNYVTETTVNYICKYVSKIDTLHRGYKSKILTSAGIGSGYEKTGQAELNKFRGENTREEYITRQGIRLAMPIYYRNKIYSESEREKLWLQRLDKGEIYVCGVRYKTEKQEIYMRALNAARRENSKLGFGSNKIRWEKEKYELQMRAILQETRIQRARKAMPAAWQLEAYAAATAERERTAYKKVPPAGFKQGDLDLWEEGDTVLWHRKATKWKNKFGDLEDGEYLSGN